MRGRLRATGKCIPMTESEDEQAGPDVPEPETKLTLHQTIELMLAKSRDNTRFGGFLNRLEVIGEEGEYLDRLGQPRRSDRLHAVARNGTPDLEDRCEHHCPCRRRT